jgi:DegV family protein with EDD domain
MIKIVADTSSSIPVAMARELDIAYLPQIIIFGSDSYRDDTEINTSQFLTKLRASSSLAKTAAPPPALYNPIFQEFATPGNTVFVITPSKDMSGTYRSAEVAAQDFPGADIRLIDTRTVAGGLGSIVLKAQAWLKEGTDPDILEARIRELASRERVYFVVDTLEYLYKGGRIGGAQALVGSLLQVKPILTLRDGHTEAAENQRTKRRALDRIAEIVSQECPHCPDGMISVMHCDAEGEARQMAGKFAHDLSIPLESIWIAEVPPAIVVHAGPKVLTISFFTASQN